MRGFLVGSAALFFAGFVWQGSSRQEIRYSHYDLFGDAGRLGYTELTEFRRADGSRSYLARERMEFWGPVLERFVVLTFDADGNFDSGHWVGTSEYSPHFSYTFRFDGRAIRGDWVDSVRGSGWSEVPTRAENPVIGFWGASRFARAGAVRGGWTGSSIFRGGRCRGLASPLAERDRGEDGIGRARSSRRQVSRPRVTRASASERPNIG